MCFVYAIFCRTGDVVSPEEFDPEFDFLEEMSRTRPLIKSSLSSFSGLRFICPRALSVCGDPFERKHASYAAWAFDFSFCKIALIKE